MNYAITVKAIVSGKTFHYDFHNDRIDTDLNYQDERHETTDKDLAHHVFDQLDEGAKDVDCWFWRPELLTVTTCSMCHEVTHPLEVFSRGECPDCHEKLWDSGKVDTSAPSPADFTKAVKV